MRLAALGVGWLAACGFSGNTGEPGPDGRRGSADADPDRPDADPSQPDATPGTPDAGPMCPSGYFEGYRFEATQATWAGAEADCDDDSNGSNELSTHLVVVDNGLERAALALLSNDQWLGLTDLAAEGTFLYVTSQASIDPISTAGNETDRDCVRLKSNAATEIRDCDEDNVYFCECDGVEPDSARFPNPPDGN